MEGNIIKPPKRVPPPSTKPPELPLAHRMPSSKVQPPIPGRKPPPSGPPPPIPSRVDLGEAPVEPSSSNKGQAKDDLSTKGSPKLKAKERPEITIVSARPMDSSGVIPASSVSSQPVPAPEIPTVPQKPNRKPKGREPPPRPKTRPVSELNLGTDEQDIGAVTGEGDSSHRTTEEVRREENLNGVEIPNKGPVSTITAPVAPVRKISKDKAPGDGVSEESHSEAGNLNPNNPELTQRTGHEVVKDVPAVKKPVAKPTVIRPKSKESTQNTCISKPPVEDDGPKMTKGNIDSSAVPVENIGTGKKNKPTVIVPTKPPKKKPTDEEELKGKQVEKEESNEIPKPDSSEGRKPPPPAKKPKPPVKPKPSSASQTLSKLSTEEPLPDNTAAPKPKSRPTVIVAAKPAKKSEVAKPDEESSRNKVQEDKPQLKPPSAAETVEVIQEGQVEEKATASPVVKPRRVPTVIIAPRPDAQNTDEVRKSPKRPQRGPSIKAAPRRPVNAPGEESRKQENTAAESQDGQNTPVSEQDTEKVQEKAQKPRRPVSLPGVKDNEVLKPNETASPVEDSNNLARKGSKKRPPPPRPPAVEPAGETVDSTQKALTDTRDPGEKSKGRSKPPPPRPPAAGNASDKPDSTAETRDKPVTQDPDGEKSKRKNRPPRPTSKVMDSKDSHRDTAEDRADEKPKPVRPAPVAPRRTNLTNKNVTETRTVAESSADDHVQDTSHTRDSAQREDGSTTEGYHEEKTEKASTKTKAKPARPPPSSVSTKNKPQRPSAPDAKPSKKAKEEPATTQVSSVCKTYIEPSAIALYDYEPTAMDDLSFNAGDEIVLVKKIDDGWYIGRLGDQEGMFPVKFVEIIEDLPQETELETEPISAQESSPFDVMSLYDFHGNQKDGELVFAAGEIIHVIAKINDDWLRGEYRERAGAFPCNFVDISTEIINKLPQYEENETVAKSDEGESSDLGLSLHCKALFDYNSDVPDDLSFSAGDVIRIKKEVSEEWFEGELHGKVGMFPAAYVEIIQDTPEEKRQSEEAKHHSVEYGTALYDFTGTAADELSFEKGDKIEITERINDDWLRGKHNGREGMFPRTFVQLSKAGSETEIPSVKRKSTPKAKALFDFDGGFEDELSFRTGDVIVLLERVNDEWLQGEMNKKVGRFPAAFVEILTPLP